MAKVNQIIAVVKGEKARMYSAVGDIHKALQKSALFDGFFKTYEKKQEDGKELPSEKQKVQHTVTGALRRIESLTVPFLDTVARLEWSNCHAKASVVVDGTTVLADVPVTYLLFLEKQLNDISAIVKDLPTLDEAEDWTLDSNAGYYKSNEVKTHRLEKKQRPIVLYDATPEHPAQAQLITEDELVGYWKFTKYSGAIPKPDKFELGLRVEKLIRAIKEAREAANGSDEVKPPSIGAPVFKFLMHP